MITKNQFVSVTYELRDVNNELIETANEKTPLEFICGQGQTLEYFEMNLLGLKAGDTFDFRIPATRAYGEIREEMIVELPREVFHEMNEEDLVEGDVLPMRDSLGRHLQGIIKQIGDDHVTIDFNHRLSGIDLYFTGKVLSTRLATDAELGQLHASKCGGCHSRGCDTGCCH